MEQCNDVVADDIQEDDDGWQGYEEDEEDLEHGPEDAGGVGRLCHAGYKAVSEEWSVRAPLTWPHPGAVCTQTHAPSHAQVRTLRRALVHACKQKLIIES